MSEMVERVSKAIYREFEARPRYAQLQMNGVLSDILARAAIEAMREPTAEMTKAARLRWNSGHDKTAWCLMIDEALK